MQKSPLPTLPGQRAPALAQDAGTGTSAYMLRACRLHLAAGTSPARLAEQAADLQPALSCQRRDLACDRSRSPASWSRDRFVQRAPHLGSTVAASSSYPLRTCRRRSGGGSLPLDLLPPHLLSSHQGAQPCLPRQVRRRTPERVPCRYPPVPRQPPASCGAARLRFLAAGIVPTRLGRLLQAAFRRATPCAALSRCLHPSHRHLQQQTCESLRGQRHLPLARLRTRQQEEARDSICRGVPAPLPAPPAATRLRAHPQLRLPRQSETRHPPSTLLRLAPDFSRDLNGDNIDRSRPSSRTLELPCLRRNHACRRTALHGSTPASLPASPRARRMNPQPQHRIILVLPHVQNLCVSSASECPASLLSSLSQPPQSIQSRAATAAPRRKQQLCKSSEPAQSHTKPIGSREGRLPSSRCIRSALPEHLDSTTCREMGASDTALT